MSKSITEQDIKNKLGISNWRELSKDKVFELVSIFENTPALDKEVYLKVIGNVPEIMSEFKEITTLFKQEISEYNKASIETKNYYINLSNRLMNLLDKENTTDEDKKQIFTMLNKENNKKYNVMDM